MPKLAREDFEILLRRAGLALSPVQITEIYFGWSFVEPMLERIRTQDRGREIEPAHVFRPDQYAHLYHAADAR